MQRLATLAVQMSGLSSLMHLAWNSLIWWVGLKAECHQMPLCWG